MSGKPRTPRVAVSNIARIEDLAFEAQVKRLTERRRWSELHAAFMLYGSTLTMREEDKKELEHHEPDLTG